MPKKPRLACVVDRFGVRWGGAEAYAVWLMQQLTTDYDIVVFARDYDTSCPIRLPFVPIRSPKFFPSWLRVFWFAIRARRLTRNGFDIVHSHMNGFCGNVEVVHVTPVRYNWRVRKKTWHKRLLSRISLRVQTYLWLEARRMALRPHHQVVAVSKIIAQQISEAYSQTKQLPIIPPGVLLPNLGAIKPSSIRATLSWGPSCHVCLLVARNPLRKGLPTLLKALARLPSHIKLLVVGGDDMSRQFVINNCPEAVVKRVSILDETSDVAPYYAIADSYIHPTLNDSFGMAPLEAMAFGLPVVLSPSPWCGFTDYIEANTEALVLNHPENDAQLAELIQQLASDNALYQRLSQASRAVAKRHSWEQVAQHYRQVYRQVLKI